MIENGEILWVHSESNDPCLASIDETLNVGRVRQLVRVLCERVRSQVGTQSVIGIDCSDDVDTALMILALMRSNVDCVLTCRGVPLPALGTWTPVNVGFGQGRVFECRGSLWPANRGTTLPRSADSLVMIPTGGTTEDRRYAMHTWRSAMGGALRSTESVRENHQPGSGRLRFASLLSPSSIGWLSILFQAGLLGEVLCLGGQSSMGSLQLLQPTNLGASAHTVRTLERSSFVWSAQLRMLGVGGGPVPVAKLRSLQRRLDCMVVNGYGCTETGGAVALSAITGRSDPDEVVRRLHPLPGVCMSWQTGHQAMPELVVATDSMCLGYAYADGTMRRLESGKPFATGDVALTRGDDQSFEVLGRSCASVTRGGRTVLCEVLEGAIKSLEPIADVAVIGVPSIQEGEEDVHSFVVLCDGAAVSEPDLRRLMVTCLDTRWVPRRVHVVQDLPRTVDGKVARHRLAAGVAGG